MQEEAKRAADAIAAAPVEKPKYNPVLASVLDDISSIKKAHAQKASSPIKKNPKPRRNRTANSSAGSKPDLNPLRFDDLFSTLPTEMIGTILRFCDPYCIVRLFQVRQSGPFFKWCKGPYFDRAGLLIGLQKVSSYRYTEVLGTAVAACLQPKAKGSRSSICSRWERQVEAASRQTAAPTSPSRL
jgi:hypothetical protein